MFNNITKIGFQNGVYLNLVANILKTLYNKSIIQGIGIHINQDYMAKIYI